MSTNRSRWLIAAVAALAWLGPAAAGFAEGPDLSLGAADYPGEDAIVLRRERHWAIGDDGQVSRREHWWVKLLDRRAIGRYADPRIDHDIATDALHILEARTHLPDGTVLPVPRYSLNVAAPDDVAGWPAYASWQQKIVSFSGIVDGCILELEYEVNTEGGIMPWLTADVRLHEQDPVVEQIITVTAPAATELFCRVDNFAGDSESWRDEKDGEVTWTWRFADLAGMPEEAQSPPWQLRCGRLRFTTCPSAHAWTEAILDRVKAASRSDDGVDAFIERVAGDEPDAPAKIEAVCAKLAATFNQIASSKATRSLTPRGAGEVLDSNYGSALDAGALLLAACRGAGLKATPMIAVDQRFFDLNTPTDSALLTIVVEVKTDDGPMLLRPFDGEFAKIGPWAPRALLGIDIAGELVSCPVRTRAEVYPNATTCQGQVTLGADGAASATLELTLHGTFFDPARLDTADAQRSFLQRYASRIIQGFEITDYAVTTLTDQQLTATIELRCADGGETIGEQRLLALGDGPAFLGDIPLPLDRSARRGDVQLVGAFEERVELSITLPADRRASLLPAPLEPVAGRWGRVSQMVSGEGSTIRLRREVTVRRDRLDPQAFAVLREAINALRANGSRHVLWDR